jgi:hypothetical protein
VINEIAIAVALTLAGSGFLTAVRRDVSAAARCWLSVPIGAVIYLIVGLVSLLFIGTLDPGPALLATLAVGVVVGAISMYRGGLTRTDFGWILVGVGLAVVTVLAARYWHLTRLTPDSLRYLLASNDLVLPDGLAEMNATDLITRQMGLPALHSLSDLVGRDYLASLGPLFSSASACSHGWDWTSPAECPDAEIAWHSSAQPQSSSQRRIGWSTTRSTSTPTSRWRRSS